MGMTDPVSDMLTRIRNAQLVRKSHVDIPASKLKMSIGKILVEEGYVEEIVAPETDKGERYFKIKLKYFNNNSVIEEITRISKPGRRHFVSKDEIPRVYQGMGISILSTSKGVISGKQAYKLGVGGEVLCTLF
ncbi:MAG: 30S ribosomal protein S8 [Magnetococcales bacterium]|nr:30S ribosomal protein S8 [Magnetococcales bacterium]